MFTLARKDITGVTRFRAAFVGDVPAPEKWDILALEEGEEETIPARRSFDVLGLNGWRRYYTVEDTRIVGPAIVGTPVKTGFRDGIFEEEARDETSAVVHYLCGFAVMLAATIFTYHLTIKVHGEFSLGPSSVGVGLFGLASLAALMTAITHLPIGKTELEKRLEKDNRDRDEILPDRFLALIRSRQDAASKTP